MESRIVIIQVTIVVRAARVPGELRLFVVMQHFAETLFSQHIDVPIMHDITKKLNVKNTNDFELNNIAATMALLF